MERSNPENNEDWRWTKEFSDAPRGALHEENDR